MKHYDHNQKAIIANMTVVMLQYVSSLSIIQMMFCRNLQEKQSLETQVSELKEQVQVCINKVCLLFLICTFQISDWKIKELRRELAKERRKYDELKVSYEKVVCSE
jgi:hypothetical protein